MTRNELNALVLRLQAMKARADKLDSIKARIQQMKDAATLQTTKAIYQTILDLFDWGEI